MQRYLVDHSVASSAYLVGDSEVVGEEIAEGGFDAVVPWVFEIDFGPGAYLLSFFLVLIFQLPIDGK